MKTSFIYKTVLIVLLWGWDVTVMHSSNSMTTIA